MEKFLNTHTKAININTSKKFQKKNLSTRLSKLKYEEKILQIKRVTKVVKGGKKMTFRAVVIVGDKKKQVGVGIGRADDVNLAIEKAILNGKKQLISISLTQNYSIPYVNYSRFGACSLMLKPASLGSGIIAGGAVRTVLELGGIKNIIGKQFGAKNILNNAKATILALSSLNEKIELAKYQSLRKLAFYKKTIIKDQKDEFPIFQKKAS